MPLKGPGHQDNLNMNLFRLKYRSRTSSVHYDATADKLYSAFGIKESYPQKNVSIAIYHKSTSFRSKTLSFKISINKKHYGSSLL